MGSKVLTSIPSVAPGVDLICAGHPADPGKLPPGMVTVPCHRCGRPVALYQTPDPVSDEPATDFIGATPDALRGAALVQDERTLDLDRTPAAPKRAVTGEASHTSALETCEMPAVHISPDDLAELSAARKERSASGRLAPPVPVEDADILGPSEPSDEPTIRQPARTPGPRRTASR